MTPAQLDALIQATQPKPHTARESGDIGSLIALSAMKVA